MPTEALRDALARYWGYTSFRPLQHEAMEAVLSGRDSIVVLPTGGGKSLCFQAPAAAADSGLAVVVSPLISLDEGSGGHARRQRRARGALQQLARRRREGDRHARARRAALPAALRVARAARRRRQRRVPRAAGRLRRALHRRRRSPLHQPVGARLPPRVPAAGAAPRAASRRVDARLHRHRHGAGAARHRVAAGAARPDRAGRVVRPAQPRLPRAAAGLAEGSSSST